MKSLTEKKVEAVELFTKVFSGSYIKMAPGDADFKIFSSDGSLIAYAEVIDANRRIRDRDHLFIPLERYAKVCMKMLNPIVIWMCDDGILYGKAKEMYGTIRWSKTRKTPLLHFSPRQDGVKYIRA
jgi:hypothetical protein